MTAAGMGVKISVYIHTYTHTYTYTQRYYTHTDTTHTHIKVKPDRQGTATSIFNNVIILIIFCNVAFHRHVFTFTSSPNGRRDRLLWYFYPPTWTPMSLIVHHHITLLTGFSWLACVEAYGCTHITETTANISLHVHSFCILDLLLFRQITVLSCRCIQHR